MGRHLLATITLALALTAPAAADTMNNVGWVTFAPALNASAVNASVVMGRAVQRVQTRVVLNVIHVSTEAAVARARERQQREPRDR
ncbi:MAG: hypothetical protein O7A68_00915 [Alphaproteobacteria bacterium]|nr:hypothetical protein [Alphaproteobacteria bacterium]